MNSEGLGSTEKVQKEEEKAQVWQRRTLNTYSESKSHSKCDLPRKGLSTPEPKSHLDIVQ